jgi:acyl-CoA synthetase (NDP forming)
LAGDPQAGSFLSYLNPVPTVSWRKALAEATVAVAEAHPEMPVVVVSPATLIPEEAAIYAAAKIPVLGSTLDALTVITALHRHLPTEPVIPAPATEQAHGSGGRSLSEVDSKTLLRPFGVRFPVETLAATADQAVDYATSLGYPVVLKASGSGLTHKTEHALVSVGVSDEAAARAEFDRLNRAGRQLDPEGYQGVLVCEQVPEGIELVLGVTTDPDFGPMVLVGSGGILAELVQDAVIAPAPLTTAQADALLARTRVDQLLRGYRGSAPADRQAAIDQLVALSLAAVQLGSSIEAIDLNPVRVLPAGRGAIALDALVIESTP